MGAIIQLHHPGLLLAYFKQGRAHLRSISCGSFAHAAISALSPLTDEYAHMPLLATLQM